MRKQTNTPQLAAIENAAQIVAQSADKPTLAGCAAPVLAGCETSPVLAACNPAPIQAGCVVSPIQAGCVIQRMPLLAGCVVDTVGVIAKRK